MGIFTASQGFIIRLFIGALVSVFRTNWFGVWIGIELTVLSFIPVLNKEDTVSEDRATFYLLVQALGSTILIIKGSELGTYDIDTKLWIATALLLKLGAAPFHYWYPLVAQQLLWYDIIPFITLMKIPPLTILVISELEQLTVLFFIVAMICGIVGAYGGIYQLCLRELLIYSSINHLGWILIPVITSQQRWLIYFLVYRIIVILVVETLVSHDVNYLHELEHAKISWLKKHTLFLGLCSLAGLPPFLGFFPKWLVIEDRILFVNVVCVLVIIFRRLITLHYYFHVGLGAPLIKTSGRISKWRNEQIYVALWVVGWHTLGFWILPEYNSLLYYPLRLLV